MIEFFQAHPYLLILGIFLIRIVDQTMDTLRVISIVRGYRFLAALAGFLEVFIWINVIGHVIQNLDMWYLTFAYAGGFAAGQAVGIWVESRIALGHQLVRIVSRRETNLADRLWEKDYPVTEVEGKGHKGPIDVVFVAVSRENIPELKRVIGEIDPDAFYTIEDVRHVTVRGRKAARAFDPFHWLRRPNAGKRK
ncbi:MAG: DUF2179 domain-containing protein [Calditrichaeota bacterium]|nr:DUF2179 domain-containing protein [Calditrichota bacterium]